MVDNAIDRMIEWIKTRFSGGRGEPGEGEGAAQQPPDDETPERRHQRIAGAAAEEIGGPAESDGDYDTVRQQTQAKARVAEQKYQPQMEEGIAFRVEFDQAQADREDEDIDFTVVIAPHTTSVKGKKQSKVSPGSRKTAVSDPELLAEYEREFDLKLPAAMDRIVERQRASEKRSRLAALHDEFASLRAQVGTSFSLTSKQRNDAMQILDEARAIAESQWSRLQPKLQRELRADPDLKAIEKKMRKLGDVSNHNSGAIRVRVMKEDGTIDYESLNIEHKVRKTDNPWRYDDPDNLTASDAPLNQAYLEALRRYGGVWPDPGSVDDVVVRNRLNRQNVDYAPGASDD